MITWPSRTRSAAAVAVLLVSLVLASCSTEGEDGEVDPVPIPATNTAYVAFAWNDLGMHCLNPTYDKAVILPPYNTVWVQVVKRGDPPEIVTTGITVQYAILGNTFSYGKRSYGQFWDTSSALFGTALVKDTGLNLVDPDLHNGLSGTMAVMGDHFQADGIPVVPVDDGGTWNPYQVAEITVRFGNGRRPRPDPGDRTDLRRDQLRQVPWPGPAPRRSPGAR